MLRPTSGPFQVALLLLAALSLLPAPARAQSGEAVVGATLGTVGGALVSMGVVTANARAGRFLYAPTEARWELLPIPLGGVAGGVLGHRNPERLWRSVGWGAGGLALGSLAGSLTGRILWGPHEGTWSGALLGGAAGLVVGSLAGAVTWEGEDPAPLALQMSIPFGP